LQSRSSAGEGAIMNNRREIVTTDMLKKKHMEDLYKEVNPWKYRESHFNAYKSIFGDIIDYLPHPLKVLELGIGEGYFANEFLDYFKNRVLIYSGIEISQNASERAMSKLDGYGAFDGVVVGDYEEMDISLSGINLVICWESLYHCNSPKGVIGKLEREMDVGAYLLVADSCGRYTVREHPHRSFNFSVVKKSVYPKYVHTGKRWKSLISFLTKLERR
jgi:ubiquinone/menaquinone biosynthesis C-methylase UbiE